MKRYPSGTSVLATVSTPTDHRAPSYWDDMKAARVEAERQADAMTGWDAVVTAADKGSIDVIGAPADGVRRVPRYDGTRATTRWGNPGIWWITAPYTADGTPMMVEVSAYFDSVEERDTAVAGFPKSLGVRSSFLTEGGGLNTPTAFLSAELWSDGVNGGRNETGIKRFQRLLALVPADRIGWSATYANSYPNLASLLDDLKV